MEAVTLFEHTTVLLEETVHLISPRPGGRYIDCTLGGGGHSERLLEESAPDGRVMGIDQDPAALEYAAGRLARFGDRFTAVRGNFRNVADLAKQHGFTSADGVVFDLGVSSPQFDEAERGFSYRFDAPLDMRMDPTLPTTAADLVNDLDEAALADLIHRYGEERFSRRIARAIAERRRHGRIERTGELAELIKSAIPAPARRSGPHPARRTFQALRIAVNDELGALAAALEGAFSVIGAGGRIAVITFHSLEDRIVKQTFQEWARGCICPPEFPVCQCGRTPRARLLVKKPVTPGEAELARNPRARSAKLRAIEKLAGE